MIGLSAENASERTSERASGGRGGPSIRLLLLLLRVVVVQSACGGSSRRQSVRLQPALTQHTISPGNQRLVSTPAAGQGSGPRARHTAPPDCTRLPPQAATNSIRNWIPAPLCPRSTRTILFLAFRVCHGIKGEKK